MIKVWVAGPQGVLLSTFKATDCGIEALHHSQHPPRLLVLSSGPHACALAIWQVAERRVVGVASMHEGGGVSSSRYLPHARVVLVGHRDGLIEMYYVPPVQELQKGQSITKQRQDPICVGTLEHHAGPVTSMRLSPSGHRLLTVSSGFDIAEWSLPPSLVPTTAAGEERGVQIAWGKVRLLRHLIPETPATDADFLGETLEVAVATENKVNVFTPFVDPHKAEEEKRTADEKAARPTTPKAATPLAKPASSPPPQTKKEPGKTKVVALAAVAASGGSTMSLRQGSRVSLQLPDKKGGKHDDDEEENSARRRERRHEDENRQAATLALLAEEEAELLALQADDDRPRTQLQLEMAVEKILTDAGPADAMSAYVHMDTSEGDFKTTSSKRILPDRRRVQVTELRPPPPAHPPPQKVASNLFVSLTNTDLSVPQEELEAANRRALTTPSGTKRAVSPDVQPLPTGVAGIYAVSVSQSRPPSRLADTGPEAVAIGRHKTFVQYQDQFKKDDRLHTGEANRLAVDRDQISRGSQSVEPGRAHSPTLLAPARMRAQLGGSVSAPPGAHSTMQPSPRRSPSPPLMNTLLYSTGMSSPGKSRSNSPTRTGGRESPMKQRPTSAGKTNRVSSPVSHGKRGVEHGAVTAIAEVRGSHQAMLRLMAGPGGGLQSAMGGPWAEWKPPPAHPRMPPLYSSLILGAGPGPLDAPTTGMHDKERGWGAGSPKRGRDNEYSPSRSRPSAPIAMPNGDILFSKFHMGGQLDWQWTPPPEEEFVADGIGINLQPRPRSAGVEWDDAGIPLDATVSLLGGGKVLPMDQWVKNVRPLPDQTDHAAPIVFTCQLRSDEAYHWRTVIMREVNEHEDFGQGEILADDLRPLFGFKPVNTHRAVMDRAVRLVKRPLSRGHVRPAAGSPGQIETLPTPDGTCYVVQSDLAEGRPMKRVEDLEGSWMRRRWVAGSGALYNRPDLLKKVFLLIAFKSVLESALPSLRDLLVVDDNDVVAVNAGAVFLPRGGLPLLRMSERLLTALADNSHDIASTLRPWARVVQSPEVESILRTRGYAPSHLLRMQRNVATIVHFVQSLCPGSGSEDVSPLPSPKQSNRVRSRLSSAASAASASAPPTDRSTHSREASRGGSRNSTRSHGVRGGGDPRVSTGTPSNKGARSSRQPRDLTAKSSEFSNPLEPGGQWPGSAESSRFSGTHNMGDSLSRVARQVQQGMTDADVTGAASESDFDSDFDSDGAVVRVRG